MEGPTPTEQRGLFGIDSFSILAGTRAIVRRYYNGNRDPRQQDYNSYVIGIIRKAGGSQILPGTKFQAEDMRGLPSDRDVAKTQYDAAA